MKRLYSAIIFCLVLLVVEAAVFLPSTNAKDEFVISLLQLPAPPPPNPLVANYRDRGMEFYNKSNPPNDNAPIKELLDYWTLQSQSSQPLGFTPKPSDRTLERILAEIQKDPKTLSSFLNVLPETARSADFVKDLYDKTADDEEIDRNEKATVKRWLTYNSPYFSADLAKTAEKAGESGEYVGNQAELLALAHVDFDRARPIVDRLYNDGGQRVSQVLAKWSLYRHALDTDSFGDINRYRDELKAVVEDKNATAGMRDLAFDALVKEKDWSGRDEWYYSLLADETLADLRVNGRSYTGLTTIVLYSPDEKYVQKMLDLVMSENPVIRAAAVRNLALKLNTNNPEIVKALLPWLDDPTWARDTGNIRASLVRQLAEFYLPESVPGLVKMLDEKAVREMPRYAGSNSNSIYSTGGISRSTMAMANAANAMANAASSMAKATNIASNSAGHSPSYTMDKIEYYPFRYQVIGALRKQKSSLAVPALKRILYQSEIFEAGSVVAALLACDGFTVTEQMAALESATKGVREQMDAEERQAETARLAEAGNALVRNEVITTGIATDYASGDSYPMSNKMGSNTMLKPKPLTAADIRVMLGTQLLAASEISDQLAKSVVDLIETLDTRDSQLSAAYRRIVMRWPNRAINSLLLRDVKNDRPTTGTILHLLTDRKELREKQSMDILDLKSGQPPAAGIAACLMEDSNDYEAILDGANSRTKAAMLACARLIRAPLPVDKVASYLKGTDNLLSMAAERYLESEDSPAARSAVLAIHPNEAKILGATTAFFVKNEESFGDGFLSLLFRTVGNAQLYNFSYYANDENIKKTEKELQNEVKKDDSLVGVYAYDGNAVLIFKDKVTFSWNEDDSRYRERVLTKYEFDLLKSYLTENRVDELTPFLQCGRENCESKELLMLGRGGGRRVFMAGEPSAFFAGLDNYFADLKLAPATLKYALSRDIPGLEILLANDEFHAETIWKDGADMRVAISDKAVQKKVKREIEKSIAETDESDEKTSDVVINPYSPRSSELRSSLTKKREYEGYSWRKIIDGSDAGAVSQPPQVELIPVRDTLAVQPTNEQWKARTATVEIRADDDGLFKLSGGKLIKLFPGYFHSPVVTPDGKWVIVYHSGGEDDGLVRINLLTNKMFPVVIRGYHPYYPCAYISTLKKILIVAQNNEDGEDYVANDSDDDTVGIDPKPSEILLLDAETGVLQPVSGEFRPLTQQTFRPLQKTAKPNEYWAALPNSDTNETQVGIFDTNHFGFKPLLKIPKIAFNSMSMWVDEPGSKVYFVYRGHLLALPMARTQ